jgi:hypothetical protein
MTCPSRADGIHDLTKSRTCACGWKLEIQPICVSIDVFDRNDELISESFNCSDIGAAIRALRNAADKLEAR